MLDETKLAKLRAVLGEQTAARVAELRNKVGPTPTAERRRAVLAHLRRVPDATVAELADRFGVHPRTIKNDRAALRGMLRAKHPCPVCGHPFTPGQ